MTDFKNKKELNLNNYKKPEFKPGSIEHRKKVAEKYHLTEQEVIDMSEEKFMAFCTGLEIGEKYGGLRATYSLLKNPDPHQVIDMIYSLNEEGRNMVLDEFCEPEMSEEEAMLYEGDFDEEETEDTKA